MNPHQQNLKTDYQDILPNRKFTAKRGVFPYAIHANIISKRQVCGENQQVCNKNENTSYISTRFQNDKTSVPKEKANPSISTNFFGSNMRRATPFKAENTQRIFNATFSNSSNTTTVNKNILLDQYLTQQYNAVFKPETSTRSKYMNINSQEAFQICVYKQIGEVLNQSFIKASLNFSCTDSAEMTSSISKGLRKLTKKRRDEKESTEIPDSFEVPHAECTCKRKYADETIRKSTVCDKLSKTGVPHLVKFGFENTRTKLNDRLPKSDKLSTKEGNNYQSTKGNDSNAHFHSPCPHKTSQENDSSSSSSFSFSHKTNRNSAPHAKKKRSKNSDFFNNSSNSLTRFPKSRGKRYSTPKFFCSKNNETKIENSISNSSSLFFTDRDDSLITPQVDKNNMKMKTDNVFTLDSIVVKRGIGQENEKLLNPIEFLKCTIGQPKRDKKKTKRRVTKSPSTCHSDSTYNGVHYAGYKKLRNQPFEMKRNKKFNLNKERYLYS